MRRMIVLLTLVGVLAAMVVVGPATAQTSDDSDSALPTVLFALMTGQREVPPGDLDGFGRATIILKFPDTICYTLTARRIAPATAAHIHRAPPGEFGPIVVALDPPKLGFCGGCTRAHPELVADIAANPSEYYVNVHNRPYPLGAIRGQLRY